MKSLPAACLPLLLTGCGMVQGFLHMRPVEVLAVWPEAEVVEAELLEAVEVTFSAAMDRPRTEQATVLTENDIPLPGRFAWRDATLIFTPAAGFLADRTYRLTVSSAAEDLFGNSLQMELQRVFHTGRDREPPVLVSFSPADGAEPADLLLPLVFRFSEPVDRGSFYTGFRLAPAVQGWLDWEDSDRVAIFRPLQAYQPGTEYLAELSREVRDPAGNPLTQPLKVRFRPAGAAGAALLGLRTGAGRALEDTTVLPVNGGLEKDEVLYAELDGPAGQERDSLLSITPLVPHTLSWNGELTECLIRFTEPLGYGSVYELEMLGRSYRLLVDGPRSVPPQVTRLDYCADVAAASFITLSLDDSLEVPDSAQACFDFYIRHAAGAELDLGSVLEAVAVHCSAAAFSFLRIELPAGSPPPAGPVAAEETVARLLYSVSDTPASGLLTVTVGRELRDSFGNFLPSEYAMQVNAR